LEFDEVVSESFDDKKCDFLKFLSQGVTFNGVETDIQHVKFGCMSQTAALAPRLSANDSQAKLKC
jgi:hypothetical protein